MLYTFVDTQRKKKAADQLYVTYLLAGVTQEEDVTVSYLYTVQSSSVSHDWVESSAGSFQYTVFTLCSLNQINEFVHYLDSVSVYVTTVYCLKNIISLSVNKKKKTTVPH